jgi:hypothetical protein
MKPVIPGVQRIEANGNELEIEVCNNGDIFVTVETRDGVLGEYSKRAQFPRPFAGGGDMKAYREVLSLYNLLSKRRK